MAKLTTMKKRKRTAPEVIPAAPPPAPRARMTYVRPWLAPYQTAAIFDDARHVVIEASSKAGKTVGCMVWLTEQAMAGKAGQNFWWVSPTQGQAKDVFRRLKQALPRVVYTAAEVERTITLANDAVVW